MIFGLMHAQISKDLYIVLSCNTTMINGVVFYIFIKRQTICMYPILIHAISKFHSIRTLTQSPFNFTNEGNVTQCIIAITEVMIQLMEKGIKR